MKRINDRYMIALGKLAVSMALPLLFMTAAAQESKIFFLDGATVDTKELPERFRFAYNSDGDNMFLFDAERPEKLFPYVDEAARAGVTSFFISPNIGMTMNFPTTIGDRVGAGIDRDSVSRLTGWAKPIISNINALVDAGFDPFGTIVDRAKHNGMEVFASFRINEVHSTDQDQSILFSSFWKSHPEWRIGNQGDSLPAIYDEIMDTLTHPIVKGWLPNGMSFAVPEVRAHRLAQLQELCERYDIDGLEIDFQRFPIFFRPGEERKGLSVMTQWMREVRAMSDRVGKNRGKPLLLVARVLATPAQNVAIGLDPITWANEGLLDFMTISHRKLNLFSLPVSAFRSALPSGFPVYTSVEMEPDMDHYKRVADSLWADGSDGIYLFNFFAPRENDKEPLFHEIHQIGYPSTLKGVEKAESKLLVVNKHTNTLSFIDAASLTHEQTIATGPNPHEIAVTPDQRYAYLSNFAPPGNTISVIDLIERRHVKQLSTGEYGRIHGAAMAPDGKHAYFTAGESGYVVEVDTRNHELVRAIPTHGTISHLVYVSPDGTRLYIANSGADDVSVLNRVSGVLIKKIRVGKGVAGMAVSPNGRQLWALNQAAGTISVIDMRIDDVVETFESKDMPTRVQFTADGKRALVAHWHERGALSVIDVATKKEIKRIPVGKHAIGVGISPDGKWAFVGCEDAGKATRNPDGTEAIEPRDFSEGVHVINLRTLTVEKVIKTGLGPDAMAICFRPR